MTGEFKFVPPRHIREFREGLLSLQPDKDGHVYLVEIVVRAKNCVVERLLHLHFHRLRTTPDGFLSETERLDEMHNIASMMPSYGQSGLPPGVIDSKARFAENMQRARWHWEPSDADKSALRSLIRRRARADIW